MSTFPGRRRLLLPRPTVGTAAPEAGEGNAREQSIGHRALTSGRLETRVNPFYPCSVRSTECSRWHPCLLAPPFQRRDRGPDAVATSRGQSFMRPTIRMAGQALQTRKIRCWSDKFSCLCIVRRTRVEESVCLPGLNRNAWHEVEREASDVVTLSTSFREDLPCFPKPD